MSSSFFYARKIRVTNPVETGGLFQWSANAGEPLFGVVGFDVVWIGTVGALAVSCGAGVFQVSAAVGNLPINIRVYPDGLQSPSSSYICATSQLDDIAEGTWRYVAHAVATFSVQGATNAAVAVEYKGDATLTLETLNALADNATSGISHFSVRQIA